MNKYIYKKLFIVLGVNVLPLPPPKGDSGLSKHPKGIEDNQNCLKEQNLEVEF